MSANVYDTAPYAVAVLPPGSTSAALQAALNSAISGDIIEISSDMSFACAVTVPAEKTVTIRSANNGVLTQTMANVRHITVNGNLILQNITLFGGNTGGGVEVNSGGRLS